MQIILFTMFTWKSRLAWDNANLLLIAEYFCHSTDMHSEFLNARIQPHMQYGMFSISNNFWALDANINKNNWLKHSTNLSCKLDMSSVVFFCQEYWQGDLLFKTWKDFLLATKVQSLLTYVMFQSSNSFLNFAWVG